MPLPRLVRPKAQGCGLAATTGLRDQETRVYSRARTEHAESVAFRRMPKLWTCGNNVAQVVGQELKTRGNVR